LQVNPRFYKSRGHYILSDSKLYCIVAPGLLSPRCVSQPQRSSGYAIGFLPCRPTKSLAALDANKLYISIKNHAVL
ncbi:MAG TPA: hypothetical protein PLA31_05505, partial [Clostridia bacterium]|nr:hypothetical protein [Clostridia bacterium]